MEVHQPIEAVVTTESTAARPVLPELLAPAGDWECAKAAVENGADAIYFGLSRFNARMRAKNFTEADLPELMAFLHRRGVRGYVTFNTLVFADELNDAQDYLRAVISSGVDAAIVQDAGVCRLIRKLSPDFPIHASTQMTITSAAGVEVAKELGCSLVVLARECSIKDIEAIGLESGKMPLEVFVHGALCVAYSGQCLTSEALGGRSANRGECAQACRMPYELISDGRKLSLGDKRYLLSPQDLAGLEVLPELVKAGVASLKIEGRLKSPEYVANITQVYRKALDRIGEDTGAARYNLEMGFSRGLYTGWFKGINNQELVHARFGKKRGVYLGRVIGIARERVSIELEAPLKPGDGVVFDAGKPDEQEEGGRIYSVDRKGEEALLGFGRGDVNFAKIRPGDRVWKTDDPELNRQLRQTFSGDAPRYKRKLNFEVYGEAGTPLSVTSRDELGNVAQAQSGVSLVSAEKTPLSSERLKEQLGRLGGTAFELGELNNNLKGEVTLPISELNKLRREVVEKIENLRSLSKRWQINEGDYTKISFAKTPPEAARITALVRNLAQLEVLLHCKLPLLYCEFEDPKKYREAVTMARGKAEIFVAPPRITKPGEEWILKQVRSCEADGYLVRNYDHLRYFQKERKVGDFSLNVANALTAEYFMKRHGLEYLTASYDLNIGQLDALLRSAPTGWFEITIHQHMPMFHMEHCVFCAFMSEGTDFRNCGRPCEKHDVKIRDRVGAEHPLKADAGCRNTVFNARAQTGAEHAAQLLQLGASRFRIEFVNETPAECVEIIRQYRQLIAGEISGSQLWRELKLQNQLGVTRGQLTG